MLHFVVTLLISSNWWQVDCIVGGRQANAPQADAAVVFVRKFNRNARIEGIKNDDRGYYNFLGIRYAESPVGERRFQRATISRLDGEVRATRACAPCPQPNPARPGSMLGDEDCLCLNIYTPKMPGDEKGSPVLFWVHGGGFRYGSANYYGGQHLVQHDTILVSVQYRLGSLGFLSNGAKDISGNAGLFDLSAALQWVLDYIEFFGGDPSRVVTVGQGSGGTAASLLALSPMSRGRVQGVAALSGAPLASNAVERSVETQSIRLARHAACPTKPPSALIACLRKMPVDNIIKADSKVQTDTVDADGFLTELSGRLGTGAAVEGAEDERALPTLVAKSPEESLQAREQRQLPLLTGVVRDETSRAVFGKYTATLMKNLENIPDYINKQIVGPLKKLLPSLLPLKEIENAIPFGGGGAGKLLSIDNYYSLLSRQALNITQGMLKIAEATGDALFNFPAFLSVDQWSEAAPAFLYSFEYQGNKTKGRHFLAGLPLVNGTDDHQFISHGDELAYLFEPLDLEGKLMTTSGDSSTQDDHVRYKFTEMLAQFAHDPTLATSNKTSFDNKKNQYFQIGEEIKLTDNFRFCQMGLWGNIQSRLQDVTCTLLEQLIPTQQIGQAQEQLTGLLKPVLAPTSNHKQSSNNNNNNKQQVTDILKPVLPGEAKPEELNLSSMLNPLKPTNKKQNPSNGLKLPFRF